MQWVPPPRSPRRWAAFPTISRGGLRSRISLLSLNSLIWKYLSRTFCVPGAGDVVLAYVSVHLSGGDGQSPSQRIGSVWVMVSAMKRREESDRAGDSFRC